MRLTIHTTNGGYVRIAEFDPANALDLQADLPDADWIAFDLDDGDTVTINAAHIVRIDFDDTPKPSWWRRLFAKEGDGK